VYQDFIAIFLPQIRRFAFKINVRICGLIFLVNEFHHSFKDRNPSRVDETDFFGMN